MTVILASPPKGGHSDNAALAAQLTDTGDWTFEPKYDGVRCLLAVRGRGTMGSPRSFTIKTRTGGDVTHCFPEMKEVSERLRVGVYDGEMISGGNGGDFSSVSGRIHMSPERALSDFESHQVRFLAFDMLSQDGLDMRKLPHYQRSDVLLDCTETLDHPWFHPVMPHADGRMLWQIAEDNNLEGLIAKQRNSAYFAGRSPQWLKLKRLRSASLAVVGWEEGEGHRAGRVGALKLAAVDGEDVVLVGKVGTGFTDADLATFMDDYISKDRYFVVEVEYQSFTRGGRLRFPSFKGIRHDKSWRDCSIAQLREGI